MPKCPKCGKEIEHMVVVSEETAMAEWDPEDGYDVTNVERDDESWRCPECDEELFKIEEEALKFFKKEVQNGDKG